MLMAQSSSTNLWRVLFLALFAFASAVPSSTQPHWQRPLSRPSTYGLPSPPTPHRNVWETLRRLFTATFERGPTRTLPFSTNPKTLKAATSKPSKHLLAQYGNELVLRFHVNTESDVSSLKEAADTLFLDVWGQSDNWIDLRLAKDVLPSFLGLLPDSLQHSHVALMQGSDLAKAIIDTFPASSSTNLASISLGRKSRHGDTESDLFFEDYRSLPMIQDWMNLLQSVFPYHVRTISIGRTYEGREIPALRVGVHSAEPKDLAAKRDTIIVSGGQHAREWISTSTVSFVASSLITAYGKDPLVTKLLGAVDFVFIPSLNPDGYQYTWDVDRLWRKNRQPTSIPFCRGMDLDRSWEFMWDGERTRDNPCSESFAGEVPFDAVESQRLAEWARNETTNNNVRFVGLLDLHSYSQQILYPYAFTCDSDPPTLEDLQELGQGLAKSIRSATGEHYKVVSACEGNVAAGAGRISTRLEGGGGSLLDWFYHEMGVRKAFQVKLRDKGSYGFLLPREDIVPTGLEILSLVKHFGRELTTF